MTIATITPETLSATIEFACPFAVDTHARISAASGAYSPTVYFDPANDVEIDGAGWTPVTGYSGQHGYSGPIMHASEFLGGRMARDVLGTPGVYVVTSVEVLDCDDCEGARFPDAARCGGDHEPAGWILLRQV